MRPVILNNNFFSANFFPRISSFKIDFSPSNQLVLFLYQQLTPTSDSCAALVIVRTIDHFYNLLSSMDCIHYNYYKIQTKN